MADSQEPTDKLRRIAQVGAVFTPGAPIDDYALFGGRMDQVTDVINAVGQKGRHVILYGERGVGKTSLANVLAEVFAGFDDFQLKSVGVNCQTGDDFASLWSNVFRELEWDGSGAWAGRTPDEPEQIRYALERLEGQALIVIDELDRLEDDDALSLLADTIQTLSDHATPVTLVLVGVADSVDDLLGDHYSVGRALTQVHLPRMSTSELEEIVDNGLSELHLEVEPEARRRIARLSEGLPFYTHSLALHAGQHAVADDRGTIENIDVSRAVERVVSKTQHSIQAAYEAAIRSPRKDTLFQEVLLAAALAPKGPLGHFTAGAVREPMSRIMGEQVEISKFNRHLNAFAGEKRGRVLEKSGEERGWFYRFRDPLLQPFVLLQGLAREQIDERLVAEMQAAGEELAPTGPGRLF
jgi:energy-coupling factor transporter ATP-binding protein EcfA2